MNEKTLTALRGSIEKWRAIADGTREDRGSVDCPLCIAFPSSFCDGCPVAQAGHPRCRGTPYTDEWRTLLPNDGDLQKTYGPAGIRAISDRAKAAARKEVAFLESLLPRQL